MSGHSDTLAVGTPLVHVEVRSLVANLLSMGFSSSYLGMIIENLSFASLTEHVFSLDGLSQIIAGVFYTNIFLFSKKIAAATKLCLVGSPSSPVSGLLTFVKILSCPFAFAFCFLPFLQLQPLVMLA